MKLRELAWCLEVRSQHPGECPVGLALTGYVRRDGLVPGCQVQANGGVVQRTGFQQDLASAMGNGLVLQLAAIQSRTSFSSA